MILEICCKYRNIQHQQTPKNFPIFPNFPKCPNNKLK